ncbi:WrbA Multimeric flavodoxin WrbA [Pyrenophora tritici-repentis]|uniref:Minor allergen Alt a n=1 Tax=Pyrenophora tritici-repentis TaxID=45151 RepID=A0A2W1FG99_9PLEO|nr:Minor allergen Alt a 7 [Pyrenophora tritici-repentis]KAI1515547.1 Minor allergen Alt a [Pyrenophora tritici-repentis]KAI1549621.1 WrbA Multimeric flavodoxin WrbA [Pyrenophora tritici-repentis]KAI1555439.1 WrbA Multimeric flavodoxin WrbA [Pyrenophora tritici-repentis]KAI1578042.1 WrbA Multimeric flavodoxin WrbA [Pyrenophora tritici-repentis]
MAPKIAIVYYSMYGHIKQLADAELKGIQEAGGEAKLFQVKETLPEEVLAKMHAPAKAADVPVVEDPSILEEFDGILFGIPTRYGNFPAQFKTFWDMTGKQWQQGAFWGKYAGLFVSTGTLGGGQESTCIAAMSTLVHHGFIYVPLGYKTAFAQLANLDEVHGGSPWGAGTFSAGDGSRQPTPLELSIATAQGKAFYEAAVETNGAAATNGTAPAATNTATTTTSAPVASSAGPQQKTEKDKEGPCGLPSKCDIM